MSDLTEQADMLLKDFNSSGYISKHLMTVLPQLVAEIKRLRTDNEFLHKFVDAPGSTLEAAITECKRLQEQLATWQKIAIKHLAWAKFIEDELDAIPQEKNYEDCREKYEREAAKELNLQVAQEAGYVERLENRLIAFMMDNGPGCTLQEAQAALEKIRKGIGDDL